MTRLDALRPFFRARRAATLPKPIADRLGLPPTSSNIEALEAALDWFARQPARGLRNRPRDEVVYQAYLGPFLGFASELGRLESLVCHLPFIVEDLRATSVLLLPLLTHGRTRRKGCAGSPFAVADSARLDPDISGFRDRTPVDDVWRDIVAALRGIGVRMGMILPLATVAMDANAIAEDPSLVYWWRAHPDEVLTGAPVPAGGPFRREAVPLEAAMARFEPPPSPDQVRIMRIGDEDHFVAWAEDGALLSVANAYPDPIVADAATYAWRDVAAIRFGSDIHPSSYQYAGAQHAPKNPAAAAYVAKALRARTAMGETIVFADVSSALPAGVLNEAMPSYPEVAVVAEQLWNFTERPAFDFVLGPLMPCVAAHWTRPETITASLAHHLQLLADCAAPKAFFAGVSNHDTAPCDGRWARSLLTLFALLPHSVPFLYSGTEFDCPWPTNLEFGAPPRGRPWPTEQDLLLFSPRPAPVDDDRLKDFTRFWANVLRLRHIVADINGGEGAVADIAIENLAVSGLIGRVRFLMNCGEEPHSLAPPLQRDRLLLSPFQLPASDRGVLAPSQGLVLALPACRNTAETIASFKSFSGSASFADMTISDMPVGGR